MFPSDGAVRAFLRAECREEDFVELLAEDPDGESTYDITEEINLAELEPLIATPSSPGNVVPVREVAGQEVSQVVIGSSANPGLRDYAIAAAMVKGRQASDAVSFDVNPSSREIFEDLTRMGATFDLIAAGARIHQAGCMGWVRRRPPGATRCVPSCGTSRAAAARSGTRSGSARPRPPQPPR